MKNVVKSKEGMVNEPPTRVLGAPETFATTTVLSTRGRFSLEDESQLFPDMCQRQAVNAKMSKKCSRLTLLRAKGDAALCSPPARTRRVRDHPRLTPTRGQSRLAPWRG